MKRLNSHLPKIFMFIPFLLLLGSCAAGDSQFTQETPAGFWYGLWHGIISVISLVVHLFNENIAVYEIHNTGGWYDLGFLLGIICIWSGGSHVNCRNSARKQRDKEWQEIGEKVEKKIMLKLKQWAEDEESVDTDSIKEWEEIGEKVEKKLKRKIREWAEKD